MHDIHNFSALDDTQKQIQTRTQQEVKIEEIQAEEVEEAEEKMEKLEIHEVEEREDERDPGVPDEVWEELKKVKMKEEIQKQKLEKEIILAKQ